MNTPKVSVIVPVYNVEQYLRQCLDSILAQTFTDWECILVDDGSTDDSGRICDEYAKKDRRFSVIHKENGGVSSARNEGISKADGEWLAFIDADDYVLPTYFESLIKGADSDLCVCGFESVEGIDFQPDDSYSIEDALYSPYLLYTPWCKLFRRHLIKDNHLLFDLNLKLCEDTIFCYQYLLLCSTIHVISSKAYYYDGKWGGEKKKYKLTESEVLYLNKAETDAIRALNKRFDVKIDFKYRGFRIPYIDNLYDNYTDYDTYLMYLKNHDLMSEKDFFSDRRLSCLYYSIDDLISFYRENEDERGYQLMRKLSRFYTLPTNIFSSCSIKYKTLHYLVRKKHLVLASMCIILIRNLKRCYHIFR